MCKYLREEDEARDEVMKRHCLRTNMKAVTNHISYLLPTSDDYPRGKNP